MAIARQAHLPQHCRLPQYVRKSTLSPLPQAIAAILRQGKNIARWIDHHANVQRATKLKHVEASPPNADVSAYALGQLELAATEVGVSESAALDFSALEALDRDLVTKRPSLSSSSHSFATACSSLLQRDTLVAAFLQSGCAFDTAIDKPVATTRR